jgi:hypothetical protein
MPSSWSKALETLLDHLEVCYVAAWLHWHALKATATSPSTPPAAQNSLGVLLKGILWGFGNESLYLLPRSQINSWIRYVSVSSMKEVVGSFVSHC